MSSAIAIPFLAALLALPAATQQQQGRVDRPVKPQVIERYRGPISFNSNARAIQGRAVMQHWLIPNGQTAEIPHQGLLIVNLRAGMLVAEIGSEKKERSADTFWSVPAGQRLIVHTPARYSVDLQTVDIVTE
jgi:hypothetical protein